MACGEWTNRHIRVNKLLMSGVAKLLACITSPIDVDGEGEGEARTALAW